MLQKMLVKYIDDKKECWEDSCAFAYNTSKHESSKFTPFEVMFGRRAVLPIQLGIQDESLLTMALDDQVVEKHMECQKKVLESVKKNIIAQTKQKEQYDKKHANPEVFKLGSIVLKKDFSHKKRAGGKMDFHWLGPYKILQALGRGLYRIEGVHDADVIPRIHGVHLKKYHTPSVEKVTEISIYHCCHSTGLLLFFFQCPSDDDNDDGHAIGERKVTHNYRLLLLFD